jgi:hypothetical protein
MKTKAHLLCWLILLAIGCQPEPKPGDVGDIAFDPAQDDPAFELCNERSVKQYYVRGSYDTPAGYRGEKKALVAEFTARYRFPVVEEENGYLTIRFVVNCRGKTGRFRVQEMDFDYQPKSFDPTWAILRERWNKIWRCDFEMYAVLLGAGSFPSILGLGS